MGQPIKAKAKADIELPLSEKELEATADQAAALMQELDRKEEEFKLLKCEWNADLKSLRLRMRQFLEDYAKKTRKHNVECDQFFDLEKKVTWYTYKGKKYNERALDEYELAKAKQQGLFGDGPDLPGVIHDVDDDDDDNGHDDDEGEIEGAKVLQGPF